MPMNMPEELGKYVVIKAYVDANHSGNMERGGHIMQLSYMSIMHL